MFYTHMAEKDTLMKKILMTFLCSLIFLAAHGADTAAAQKEVWILPVSGAINPVVADFVESSIIDAEKAGVHAIVIQLDTPGGLLDSTRQIIQAILRTQIPVIIYVYPQGGRAASAGVFITMASDIAAMAPSTNIGAAHPVQLGGGREDSKATEDKAVQDAQAYIRSLAKEKERNWQWAEEAVSKSLSVSGEEALKLNVIDIIARDYAQLYNAVEGRTIDKNGRVTVLSVKDANHVTRKMSILKQLINVIANPNIAYILLILGIYGFIYEFSTPGIGLGLVAGSICLVLAFFSMQLLPTNIAGVLLIVISVILFMLEIQTPSYGILTVGGIAAFLLGSFIMFRSPEGIMRISIGLIIAMAGSTTLFFAYAVSAVFRARRKKVTTGMEGMIGLKGVVLRRIATRGTVIVRGEIWSARSSEELDRDEEVEVIGYEGNILIVKKVD